MKFRNKRNKKQRRAKEYGNSFKLIGEWKRMIHLWWNKEMASKRDF